MSKSPWHLYVLPCIEHLWGTYSICDVLRVFLRVTHIAAGVGNFAQQNQGASKRKRPVLLDC